MKKVSKFWELLEESVLIQAIMALGMLGSIIYLVVAQLPVPDILVNGFLLILGFYFGSKSTVEAKKTVDKLTK